MKKKYNLNDLIDVMASLRNPHNGCPWDLDQNFKSIAPYTLEEAYEVVDAIERHDMSDLKEELGDLLFQSIYHAQMASELGSFDIHDVVHAITAKMIYRHPHVFGDDTADNAKDVDRIWEQRKEKNNYDSALDGVTRALPALLKATKLQKKASKVGFKWDDVSFVLDKLEEEILEMREAISNNDQDNQEEELGDILFLLANYGRMLNINPEEALRKCNNKFERRFRSVESDLRSEGIGFADVTLQDMQTLWNKAKSEEKG